MFKQTVLKFQGALGLLGFDPKGEEEERDIGNSATHGSWDDDENDEKKHLFIYWCPWSDWSGR
jgi:hypothetical protein